MGVQVSVNPFEEIGQNFYNPTGPSGGILSIKSGLAYGTLDLFVNAVATYITGTAYTLNEA